MRSIYQHEMGRGSADFCAGHHQPEMSGLDVFSSGLEAMIHGGGKAGFIARQAGLNAARHFLVHSGFSYFERQNQ
jgi:hypothetical protein